MAHDYTKLADYISENPCKELPLSGYPVFDSCTDEFRNKLEMVTNSEYIYKREHFTQIDNKLFHSYVAFTFGGIDFETYCKMWSIFGEENGIKFSREYVLKMDSSLIYSLNEQELFRVNYDKARKDFFLFVYQRFRDYMVSKNSNNSTSATFSNVIADLYDERAIGLIRRAPITYDEFADHGWKTSDYITYIHLCKILYAASVEESKIYFDIENVIGEKKHPNVIAAIINIKRFLYTKGIYDALNRKYCSEFVEKAFAYGLQHEIYYSKFLPLAVRGNNYRDVSSYIRDFDSFRMKIERALCWSNAGENYCLMHYVDGYFESARDNVGFDAFLDFDLSKYDFNSVELLIKRLTEAKRIHEICRDELNSKLSNDLIVLPYTELMQTIDNFEFEEEICYYIDDFLEKLTKKKQSITPNWTTADTLYIYKGKTSCHTRKHEFISATAVLFGKNYSEVKLNVEYCRHCKKFFMSYTVYESYREKYGMLLGKLRMDSASVTDFADIVLSECSPLKLCGYSVSQQVGYSTQERQYIISKVIELGVLQKSEVIRYLEYFINMNGRKTGNEVALSKWKQDLEFALKYKLSEQREYEIRHIKKY